MFIVCPPENQCLKGDFHVKQTVACLGLLALSVAVFAQETRDPFPTPIEAQKDAIVVGIEDFAVLPDVGGKPAQMKTAALEPGSGRLLVSDMAGIIYRIDGNGAATPWLEMADSRWATAIDASWREQGLQSFAYHPQFAQAGTPGYGRVYTWYDGTRKPGAADFTTASEQPDHDTVLLEWTAKDVAATRYDGGPPRELMRLEQPFRNHNGGAIAFNPVARPGDADFGLLYIGVGDGGSAGDPLKLAQDRASAFGKILRIDPLGTNSSNGHYGIPAGNPFVGTAGVLPEIYAYGLRNPQQFAWDSRTGDMMTTDIGQSAVEEVSLVEAGDNLGWSVWEGSFRFSSNSGIDPAGARGDAGLRYPLVEFDHIDPLLLPSAAATGLQVVRGGAIPELQDKILFGELALGELFYVDADDRPDGGQSAIRRVLFDDGGGQGKTLVQLVREKYAERGMEPPFRTDMRVGMGPDGEIYLINKYDGVVRRLKPLRQ